jgi:bifunctional non-homologous end joining protein LigD
MLEPMLASLADAPLTDPSLVYEPKYDGIRAIADVTPGQARLWSRLGNEKTAQFSEVAQALGQWARKRKISTVIDGEIVAIDQHGDPIGFQNLQGRIHLTVGRGANRRRLTGDADVPTAFIAFDLLREGTADLRDLPLHERRARLERLFRATGSSLLRLSEQVRGDGRALYQRALDRGWEGLIAKHADSQYRSGKRTPDWRKVKITCEQEFVIGGWTEPRQTRTYFGALLLGVYEKDRLIYVGHVGTGFNERELARLMKLLRPLEIDQCPFAAKPASNERPHWVRPVLVTQVRFTEWTADDKLRHPVYLGLRDDKRAEEVTRERPAFAKAMAGRPASAKADKRTNASSAYDLAKVIDQLRALEEARRDGVLELPGGQHLKVTNLHKVFWPKLKITKGELFRYYAQVSPFILPAVADRPLVMKRMPDGINGQTFYQHRSTDVPSGVRTAIVEVAERRPHIIGGDLLSLLYMTQLAAISQDPWFSRVQSPDAVDHVALDLDPAPGVPFARVRDVALWIRDELDTLGATGFPKTSGSEGLHVYIPMPPGTPYEAGLIYSQIIATVVAGKHPKHATIERAVRGRGQRVYVDFLQNILGKTLATAYSARASQYAGVSTPLTWQEVEDGVEREAFTMRTVSKRLERVGDLWLPLLRSKGVDLARVSRYAKKVTTS